MTENFSEQHEDNFGTNNIQKSHLEVKLKKRAVLFTPSNVFAENATRCTIKNQPEQNNDARTRRNAASASFKFKQKQQKSDKYRKHIFGKFFGVSNCVSSVSMGVHGKL